MNKKIENIIVVVIINFVALFPGILNSKPGGSPGDESVLYGKLKPLEYLSGNFRPERNSLFIALDTLGIPGNRKHYLRKETAEALLRMYREFHRDHPEVPFRVISSTRNRNDQKSIWESKWNGKRKVDGVKLNLTIKDPKKRALKILEYSSMPGTSRHHWGTDFDLNNLNNSYFLSGKGKILFDWLTKNALRFGFCRPYTAGRDGGYHEEKWHWSYRPLSSEFIQSWNQYYRKDPLSVMPHRLFDGVESARELAPEYVNQISSDCIR